MTGTPIPELKERLDIYWKNGKLAKEEKDYLDNWRIIESKYKIQSNNFQFKTASIIGGGISGYVMALCLKRNGIISNIYERKIDHTQAGLGFLLLKNGIDALNVLGLKSKVLKKGNPINYFKAISPDEKEIYTKPLEDCIAISRKNLMDLLSEEFDENHVKYNMSFEKINYSNEGSIDSIQFENGKQVKSDVYFGSDGIRSSIRNQIFPNTELASVGEEEIVGIVHLPELKSNKDLFLKVIDSEQGCSMGLIPLLEDQYIWFFQFNSSLHQISENKPEIIQQFMTDRVINYPKEFQSAIKNTNFNKTFLWVSKRMDLLPKFHKNNMVLVGDAAHPLLAFTSQGANSAIEDALCLASLLSKQKPEETFENVFEDYYAKRKVFIQKYINEGDELIRDFLEMKTSNEYKIPLAIH
jgi:2-polyprenyl-6-methoxyphenol hydroxylase-like FAD-dependent oxidoreductase